MSKPKIIILAPQRPGEGLGGAEQHLDDLAHLLTELGADVMFCSRGDAGPPGLIHRALERLIPLMRSPLAVIRLRQLRTFTDADLVITIELMGVGVDHPKHLHLFFGSYAGFRDAALPPATGLKRLIRDGVTGLARYLEKRTQGSLGAIANSIGLRDCLRAHRIPIRDEVLLPPTDTDRFRPGKQCDARRSLGLPIDGRLLLFAGRWEYAKGADRIARLLDHMPTNWRLVLATPSAGTWPWPIDERVIRLTDVPNQRMPLVYQAADILIQPSRFEGYSLVVSEAQACGCPVVTSNVGHAAHLLKSSSRYVSSGVVTDADDPQAWLQTIKKFDTFDQATAAASQAAREFAEQSVSHASVGREWSRFLETILPEFEWHRH